MSNLPDGGQDKFDGICARKHRYSYLVRMIKPKPDPISRLARSTNLSKILKVDPPERDLLDRGPDCYIRVSPNLIAHPALQTQLHLPAFLRELSKFTKASTVCQHRNLDIFNHSKSLNQRRKARKSALRKISKSDRQNARATRAHRRSTPGSCNGLFSLGIPYRGSGAIFPTSPDPTNRLPTSLIGQTLFICAFAPRATGGSTACCPTFKE
jgi:hypothetical protein